MHELSITRNVVAIVAEHAQGKKVLRVRVEIGRMSGVVPSALEFCFGVCAKGTTLEDAVLEIVDIPGRGLCAACGAEPPLDHPLGRCPVCRELGLKVVAGQELNIKEMELASCV